MNGPAEDIALLQKARKRQKIQHVPEECRVQTPFNPHHSARSVLNSVVGYPSSQNLDTPESFQVVESYQSVHLSHWTIPSGNDIWGGEASTEGSTWCRQTVRGSATSIENDASFTQERSPEDVNKTTAAIVCFGMATNLPVVLEGPGLNVAQNGFEILYDPSTTSIKAKGNKGNVGHVMDRRSQEILSALCQEDGVQLQIQLHFTAQTKTASRTSQPTNSRAPETNISVIMYGPNDLCDDIGDFLQQNECHLQEPRGSNQNVPYRNPHSISSMENEARFTFDLEVIEEKATDPANLLAGLETDEILSEAPDPAGLKSPLYSHQKQALSFMIRREKGWAFNLHSSDIWGIEEAHFVAPQYVNNVTGDKQREPPPTFRGGILADDMGLGKTLTMISLIASDHNLRENKQMFPALTASNPDRSCYQQELRPTTATILVVPSSVLQQWEMQLDEHLHSTGPAAIWWRTHHGTFKLQHHDELDNYALVLTSFETVAHEYRKATKGVLFTTLWHRIVLDEAHAIRNERTTTAQAVFDLAGTRRWAISGTPIQNRLSDFSSLLRFLRIYPYCSRTAFDRDIVDVWKKGDETLAFDRLKQLFKFISIRRLNTILNLPPRTNLVHHVQFDDAESAAYQALESPIVTMIDQALHYEGGSHSSYMKALAKINLLRKFCNLGLGTQQVAIGRNAAKSPQSQQCIMNGATAILEDLLSSGQDACALCNSNILSTVELTPSDANTVGNVFITQCSSLICVSCYNHRRGDNPFNFNICTGHFPCEVTRVPLTDPSMDQLPASPVLSTKVKELQRMLSQHGDEKCVIFSSWTTTLDMIQRMLQTTSIKFVRIDGRVPIKNRPSALTAFQTDPSVKVMLLSIFCGAEGLNLTAASRAYIMEPQWNPNIESQALARIHRLGQTRSVTTVQFIMKDSIESHVLNIQDRKRHLGDLLLSQQKRTADMNHTRLSHLRSLLR